MNQLTKRGMYGCYYFEDGAYSTEYCRRTAIDYPRFGDVFRVGVLGDGRAVSSKSGDIDNFCGVSFYSDSFKVFGEER